MSNDLEYLQQLEYNVMKKYRDRYMLLEQKFEAKQPSKKDIKASAEMMEKEGTFAGHDTVAKKFIQVHGRYHKSHADRIFGWSNNEMLWKPMQFDKLVQKICFWLGEIFTYALSKQKDEDVREKILKSRRRIVTHPYSSQIAKLVVPLLDDEDFVTRLDTRTDVVNFKNGLYDLRTGKFRKREITDLFSKCLNFDLAKPKEDKIKFVETIMRNIANDREEDFEAMKAWFGFNMTGETNKSFLLLQGPTADNGKSTLCKMFIASFPIYGKKIDRDFIYQSSKATRHKTVAELHGFRMILIEEMERHLLDTLLLKEWSDGGVYPYKIMYGTEGKLKVQSKLNITTNNDPKFPADNGIGTRGFVAEFMNKFVSQKVLDKFPGKAGYYLKDTFLENKFIDDDGLKLALFHILAPYATSYYTKGLELPQSYKDKFLVLSGMNDPTQGFIADFFEVSGKDEDKIFKEDLLNDFKMNSGMRRCTVNYLTSELKKHGIRYDKDARVNGKKGCYLGIRKLKDVEKGDGRDDGDDDFEL